MGLNCLGWTTRGGCALLACFSALTYAQPAPVPSVAAPQSPGISASTHTVSEGRIHLDVVVTDQADKPVSGLTSKDFTLLDNNQPAKIVSFKAVEPATSNSGQPVEVILLLDALNSTSRQAAEAQKALVQFLRQGGGRLAQPVSIYRLSDAGLSVTPELSTDGNALAAAISQKKGMRMLSERVETFNPIADMAFQNQLYRVSTSLNALGSIAIDERRKPGRKILIWIGSGWPVGKLDFSLFGEIVDFSTQLREARITLDQVSSWPPIDRNFHYTSYLAGVKSGTQSVAGDLALEVLAAQTGGRVSNSGADLSTQIAECIAAAGIYYALSFDPPRTSTIDEYHDLKVALGKPGLAARTNTGYYNQPAYYDQPFVAAEHLTVEQLEQLIGASHANPDAELARRLSGVELTERMTTPRLTVWKDRLPGPRSWSALVALADASAFLSPPAADIPATPPPDLATQREIIAQSIHYLSETITRLPNLFATRTTVSYGEQPQKGDERIKVAMGDRSLHLESVSAGTVLYRNGAEAVDAEAVKGKKPKKSSGSLTTRGTFGPILSMVILDGVGVPGAIHWDRWEQGATGPEAVFRYAIPADKSHFEVSHCCFADGTKDFQEDSGYHGEIAIDPSTGAILRLTLESELRPDAMLARSATLVEYGSQDIAGKTYICPMRSVSISRGRRTIMIRKWGEDVGVPGPYETVLNDVSFGDYHIFRSDSRILIGEPPPPDQQ